MLLLIRAEEFERFLQKRYGTYKRYSGEGGEALILALNTLIAEAAKQDPSSDVNTKYNDQGISTAVLGMPHRGRLATLVALNDYPARNLLYKIAGNNDIPAEIRDSIDDIPTHIAVSNTKKFSTESGLAEKKAKRVTMTMVHNPSHLESQNSISMGKTRAKIDDMGIQDTR